MALDLFSGTRGVGNGLENQGDTIRILDSDSKFIAEIRDNRLRWDCNRSCHGKFKIITASLTCTEFGPANTIGERKLREAMAVVTRTLEIIEYFDPPVWWLETSDTDFYRSKRSCKEFCASVDRFHFKDCGF